MCFNPYSCCAVFCGCRVFVVLVVVLGVVLFYDGLSGLLRGEGESTLIKRLERKTITQETFNENAERAGVIMLRSSYDFQPENRKKPEKSKTHPRKSIVQVKTKSSGYKTRLIHRYFKTSNNKLIKTPCKHFHVKGLKRNLFTYFNHTYITYIYYIEKIHEKVPSITN